MSHTLTASGVFTGEPQNVSGDLLPPEPMYEACRVFARYVTWRGGLSWDWGRALAMDPPREFTQLIEDYLSSVLASDAEHRGWKIPETTLCYPWIQRMFPEAKFIIWMRDPRDSIIGAHKTDDLRSASDGPSRISTSIAWCRQRRGHAIGPRCVSRTLCCVRKRLWRS